MYRTSAILALLLLSSTLFAQVDPYYPHKDSPRLLTPQWVGEDGVEAVVILAIDDMKETRRYEAFLRPILRRLQEIDGRAPVSIMTNAVSKAREPLLQQWLREGLSLECHTFDHPCPFFKYGFTRAKNGYDRCVDFMHTIPNNKPVAFRMPCCDSLNTPSPRFYAEIFNKTTPLVPVSERERRWGPAPPGGHYLSIDSSVFTVFTSNDPELPRALVQNADGTERFLPYLPADRSFVNTIENYPYPYVIGGLCWEFPCMTPSDWQAQHRHKANNPKTVEDWKAALDCTVIKQGVMTMVYHPHGWIKSDQLVDLIDYADKKYGKKVKFLNFREALERLDKFGPKKGGLRQVATVEPTEKGMHTSGPIRLGDVQAVAVAEGETQTVYHAGPPSAHNGHGSKLPFSLPPGARVGSKEYDSGLRFIDIDGDGYDDIVFSSEDGFGVYLFKDMKEGWTRKVAAGKAGSEGAVPLIAFKGQDMGCWAHSGQLWWSNEGTALLKDHVARLPLKALVQDMDIPALSPEQGLKAWKPRPGFQVELMAAEPLVKSPIAFAFGPDGKLWVVEMGDYPLGLDGKGKPGGKIKVLEDTKGTGKYDKATVFMEDLPFPTGVLPWRNGVLVTCAPDIFYAEDTSGSGKADKKVVLLSGFQPGNQQHRVNGPFYGLDNWVYVANGDSGGYVKSHKTGKTIEIRGRDLRFKPDTGELEEVSGQTQYGHAPDDWGNRFGGNNSNPCWHFALDDHYIRRNTHVPVPDPRVAVPVVAGNAPVYPASKTLPRFNDFHTANRFTSACSPIIYRDNLFGPAYAGNLFLSEPVHNLVHREVVQPKGITFTSNRASDEQTSEFLASTDNWCRPTMIQTGPDGALWIADMYRFVIEHPQWIPKDWQAKLDLRAGADKGRIYRVYPVGVKPRAIPRLDRMRLAELVACLESPSGWQRDLAQRLLVQKNDYQSVPLLEKLFRDSKEPLARLHALCTLDGLGELHPDYLRIALADAHPGVRKHAIRLLEKHFNAWSHAPYRFLNMDSDADPQVRLQLAYTLGEWKNYASAGKMLARLTFKDGTDPYALAAIFSSIHKDNFAITVRALLQDSSQTLPEGVLEKLARTATALGDDKATAALLGAIALPQSGRYSAAQFAALGAYLDALNRRNLSLEKVSAKARPELQKALAALAPVYKTARDTVADAGAPLETRVLAARLLARGLERQEEDRKMLAALLTPQTPEPLQAAAIHIIGSLRGPEVPGLLVRGWKGYGPSLRTQVLDTLLSRTEWLTPLLDAIERKEIPVAEISASHRQRLLEQKIAAVKDRAAKLLASPTNVDLQKLVETYKAALTLKGDGFRGAAVFKKNCAACHQLGGLGQHVGPDLAAEAGKPGEVLLIAILDPNQAVEARYINYVATLKNGKIVSGLIASETGGSLTLVSADGQKVVIPRSDLDDLVSTGKSVMPEGLEKDIALQDMADLIAFIRKSSPVQQRKVFEGNNPALVKANADGVLSLLAGNGEIYGKSLVLEKQYGNLGMWLSGDDRAVWTMEVPQAGKYAVWLDWACDNKNAGNSFVLDVGESPALTVKVLATGSWDTYRYARLGVIELPAGRQTLTMRPLGPLTGALIDLKGIKLVPMK